MNPEDQSRSEFEAVMQAAMYYGVAHTGAGHSSKDPEILAMRRESHEKLQAAIEALQQASRRTYRASVLEEAAKLCEDKWTLLTRHECAEAIRELAAKTQEGQEP